MYTSDKKLMRNFCLTYILVTIFCVAFGSIYELFSHEVYSYYMIYFFVIPLISGIIPYFIFSNYNVTIPDKFTYNIYNSGIAILTVGCTFNGVLEIYGTTNKLVSLYWFVGSLLIIIGVISYTVRSLIKPN